MNKRFMGLGMLGAFLLAAAPAFAQGVDDKIKALEQELMQLKEQQIELKKDATAAAAAMPAHWTSLEVPSRRSRGTMNSDRPLVPGGASGVRARTRWTMFFAMS